MTEMTCDGFQLISNKKRYNRPVKLRFLVLKDRTVVGSAIF